MKLESPEMRRSSANVLLRWDPLLLVDCHTTDGSFPSGAGDLLLAALPQRDRPSSSTPGQDAPAIDTALEKKYGTLSSHTGPMDSRTWRRVATSATSRAT